MKDSKLAISLTCKFTYISYLPGDCYLLTFSLYKVSTVAFDDGVCLT